MSVSTHQKLKVVNHSIHTIIKDLLGATVFAECTLALTAFVLCFEGEMTVTARTDLRVPLLVYLDRCVLLQLCLDS